MTWLGLAEDRTVEAPVHQQMKVELPAIPSLESREDAERAAEAIRERLESQDAEIKTFLGGESRGRWPKNGS